ncbi:hypothetical protein V5799_023439 [Amblyomma americanum]|uniref:Secreted protein n=1 Tax=Amblyomma americanum TaxID=6943 RepID=A0AAQ4FJJ9_AMBAM
MNSTKQLLFALLATCLLATTVLSSIYYGGHPYGPDIILPCNKRCYRGTDGSDFGYPCPPGCTCIPDAAHEGYRHGWGSCFRATS